MMSQATGTPELRDATSSPLPEASPALALGIEKTRDNIYGGRAAVGLSVQRAVSRRDDKRKCLTPLIAGAERSIL